MGQALEIATRHKTSWCDALIVASAIEGGCDVLYSEDLHGGLRAGGLRIVNPFQDGELKKT